MKNFENCRYTYLHRKAFLYCVNKIIKDETLKIEMLKRAKKHDMDKMLMYLFLDPKTAQKLHVNTASHHLENTKPKTYEDLVETVIDYECAPYTKPDKPYNAFKFTKILIDLKVLDNERGNKLLEIMADLKIDKENTFIEDKEGQDYIASLKEVNEEDLLEEILTYVNENPENELDDILNYIHSQK